MKSKGALVRQQRGAKLIKWVRAQDATAVRNALSLAIPLAVGTAFDQPGLGALAAIGGFTAMYTANRPYRQRLRRWALVASLLLISFMAGLATAGGLWLGIVVIGVVAAVLTYALKLLAIGPPAAYMLVLACATGTHLPPDESALGQRVLVIVLGSVTALAVCSAGWLFAPDGPERRAVSTAMRAVAIAVRSGSGSERPLLNQAAYRSLHEANMAIVVGSGRTDLGRLMRVLHDLRSLLDPDLDSGRMPNLEAGEPEADEPDGAEAGVTSEQVGAALDRLADAMLGSWPLRRERREVYVAADGPLNNQPELSELALSLTAEPGASAPPLPFPDSLSVWRKRTPRALRSGLRAGIAATAAGAAAAALDVDRPYWGAAAAVAVLAGDGTKATLIRGWNRFAGTILGVLVAAGILALAPAPAMIVVIVAVLQLLIQLVIKRSYGLAVVAITPLALLLADAATGSLSTDGIWPRLAETAIGCGLALIARFTIFPGSAARALPAAMSGVKHRLRIWLTGPIETGTVNESRRLAVERSLLALHDAVEAAKDEMFPRAETTANIEAASKLLSSTWPLVTTDQLPPDAKV